MKLSTVLLIATIMQVSAASFAQKLTLKKDNISLEQLFREIRKQTGYAVIFTAATIKDSKTIDADFTNTPIEEVLNTSLKNQNLAFEIDVKNIIITKKSPTFLESLAKRWAAIDVRGIILDEKGSPLVGATVAIKGKNRSVKTDQNGAFFLANVGAKDQLVISYIGYENREVDAASNMGSLTMVLADSKLEEVEINAGYYTVKQRNLTGSISRITSKDIEKQPVNNVLAAMQANIPGVQITQTSGVPGGGFTVQVRGQNSFQQGNDPFYIVDGVPFIAKGLAGSRSIDITKNANPLASINPNDIESIEVLKDADATAIYGSRGANGVILITTKRGKAGKTSTTFSINQGIARVGKKLDLMNTEQYLTMRKEALSNDNLPISSTDYDLNGTWDEKKDTDWQKELIGKIAPTTNIQTSLSGGAKNITYLIGANYYREATVFPGSNLYGRGSANFNLHYVSDNKKLNISFGGNYSHINSDLFLTDLTQFITLSPNYPTLKTESGGLNWENNTMVINPMANILQSYNSKTNNLIGNGIASYVIIPDLTIKASFGYSKMDRHEFGANPLIAYSPALGYGASARRSNFTDNSINTWITETQVDWSKKIGNNNLNVLLGATFQQNLTDGQEVTSTGYASDALMGNIASASTLSIAARSFLQYRYTAIFARVNYNILNKYIANITGRRDGSSRFGTENRFANFGAVGVAWIISQENIIKTALPFISFAKLRGSYGITGNDQISDYGYLELWNSPFAGNYQGISTMAPKRLANPKYAWEINKKAEVDFDLGFLRDRINLSVGYYSNRSSNQLLPSALPPSTGFTNITDNLSATISNTGWEFELNTKNVSTKAFKWSTSINLTIPKNKLLDFPGLGKSAFVDSYEIGKPLSIKKLFKTGVDMQSGLYVRDDFNKDGIIDNKDRYIIEFVGRKFYGGIQNTFSYNNLELDFIFQFVKQTGIGYVSSFNLPGAFSSDEALFNQPIELIADHWKNSGDNNKYQKFSTQSSANTTLSYARNFGHLTLENASFIRLKNISISYSLSKQFISKLKLNNAKFFLQGQNLFTITPYKGLDPETLSRFTLPTLKVFTAGLQITL